MGAKRIPTDKGWLKNVVTEGGDINVLKKNHYQVIFPNQKSSIKNTLQKTGKNTAKEIGEEFAEDKTVNLAKDKIINETKEKVAEEVKDKAIDVAKDKTVEKIKDETIEEVQDVTQKIVRENSNRIGENGVHTSTAVNETKVDEIKGTGAEGKVDVDDVGKNKVEISKTNTEGKNKTLENQTKGIISEADRKKLNSWENKISDELYLEHKKVFDNPKYYDQKTGWSIWPGKNGDPNTDGFLNGKYTDEMLQPGQMIDRYGGNKGKFFADVGTPIPNRAMAPDSDFSLYNQYRVNKEIPVRKGEIAPWFDEPGGGIQYMLDPDFVKKIEEIQKSMKTRKDFIDVLIEMGYLDRL